MQGRSDDDDIRVVLDEETVDESDDDEESQVLPHSFRFLLIFTSLSRKQINNRIVSNIASVMMLTIVATFHRWVFQQGLKF